MFTDVYTCQTHSRLCICISVLYLGIMMVALNTIGETAPSELNAPYFRMKVLPPR